MGDGLAFLPIQQHIGLLSKPLVLMDGGEHERLSEIQMH